MGFPVLAVRAVMGLLPKWRLLRERFSFDELNARGGTAVRVSSDGICVARTSMYACVCV
eukprot:JP444897.1.p3 GENE.JP444897.1~~JP444897.1.p3  ORF type:complete len:59 (-),score=3.99 JP444897.1:55-231(-)